MPLELLFLGTGTSAGVPMIGCHCAVCSSSDPRDHRTRPSVMVSYPDPAALCSAGVPQAPMGGGDEAREAPVARRAFLIDTSPEMRIQLVRHSIDRIDGVIYTHAHADHIFG